MKTPRNILSIIAIAMVSFFINPIFAQSWQSVGGGTDNSSHGMLVWNSQLINVGSFNNPCGKVAAWDGTSWNCLGSGVGIVGRAATVWQGKLVVVGDFWNVQQPCVGCNGVAVWDGVSWTPLGNGVNNDVLSVAVWNNELVIAGDFTQANGVPVARVIKWNESTSTWESIGQIGDFDNDIRTMVEWNGEFYVGGDFNNVGGNSPSDGLVKWDPSTSSWVGGNSGVDLVGGVNETVRVLYVNPNDNLLYMGGEFPELHDGDAAAPDFNMSGVAVYDGQNWSPLGTGLNDYVRAMHEYNGQLVCGGYFTTAGGVSANKIAKWNPTTSTWSAMGMGFDGVGIDEYVKSAAVWNGTFFAGGAYTQAEGNPMNFIAQWYEAPSSPPVAWMNYSSTSVCGNGCIDFLDNSTNTPTSWNWSFPGSNTPTSTLQNPGSVCYSTAGTHTATLQACNSFGCTSQSIDITVASAPTLTVNDVSICDGNSAVIDAVPSTSGGSYLWYPNGETTPSITVSPSSNTTYSVEYTLFGCTSSLETSNVTVGSAPSVSVNGATSICEGETATLMATPSSGGGTYEWTPTMETTSSISASPSATTDYTVEYTLNGCTSSPEIVTINVQPAPTGTVNSPTICAGETISLSCTPDVTGGSFLWSPGNQTTSSISVSPSSSTNYSVVYTLNGCESSPIVSSVTVQPAPSISLSNLTLCEGESGNLTATPSQSGGSYLWSPNGETSSTISVSPASTTTYSVVYSLSGCDSQTESTIVSVAPIPTISLNNLTICEGQSGMISTTPSQSGGTYLWSAGGETTPDITVSPTSSTSYSVIYTLNGCESYSETSTVTVTSAPTVSVNDLTLCIGESGTITATPSQSGGTYLWSPGGETTPDITVSPTSSASYSVVYTLNGCESSSETSTVSVNPIPTVTISNLTLCEGESGTLSATPDQAGGTYLWSPGGETTSSISVSPGSTTSYSIIYTLNGCESSSMNSSVIVNDMPITTSTTSGSTITVDEANGAYQWIDCDQGNSPIANETNQSYTASTNGNYAAIIDLNGCIDTTACVEITGLTIDENSNMYITIYPNPTESVLYFKSDLDLTGSEYVITDVLGRVVLSGTISNSNSITISDLANGRYNLQIDKFQSSVTSFIKE